MTDGQAKVLVIRGGAIGDLILTLPALAALRAQFPQVHLELLGYPHIAQLALAGGVVDAVQPIESRALASFFAHGAILPKPLTDYFGGFALIVSYLYDPDGVFRRNVAACSRAQYLPGPHRPAEDSTAHATDVFLKPLERLTIFDADPVPRLTLDPGRLEAWAGGRQARGGTTAAAGPWLAAHPGSGSDKKNWPADRWGLLIEQLAVETAWNLLLVGGEAEGERLEQLAARWPCGRLEVARSWPLVALASRLARCDAYLGHDSGITHLAAALGVPSLVLWGETNATIWAPRHAATRLLRAEVGLPALEVRRVRAELLDFFPAKENP